MTVHDDLATLTDYLDSGRVLDDGAEARAEGFTTTEDAVAALARVEAEIARLEQERDAALDRESGASDAFQDANASASGYRLDRDVWRERAEAAEDEVARLRDGLRRIENIPAGSDDDGIQSRAIARALLADQDGAA